MSILPSVIVDSDINRDGSPRPGTMAWGYLQDQKELAYRKGKTDAETIFYNNLCELLHFIIFMDFEAYDKKVELMPAHAKEFLTHLSCLVEYTKGLKTQVNNMNRTNFREGTRNLILRAERILGLNKGTIINTLLRSNMNSITDGRTIEAKNRVAEEKAAASLRARRRKRLAAARAAKLDPTDVLINNEVEEPDEVEEEEEMDSPEEI